MIKFNMIIFHMNKYNLYEKNINIEKSNLKIDGDNKYE